MPGRGLAALLTPPSATGPVGERVLVGGRRHYRLPDGRLAPSVTTVLDVIAKPQLDRWLDRREGAQREAAMRRACGALLPTAAGQPPTSAAGAGTEAPTQAAFLRAYNEALALVQAEARATLTAAQVGTLVHDAIAWALRSELGILAGDLPDLSASSEAATAFSAWSAWWETAGVRPVLVERFVYSVRHGFAGTLDFVYEHGGRRWLLDWKTGTRPYPTYYLQLRAYQLALEEMGEAVDDCAVVMLPKDGGTAELYPAPATLTADAFLGALALWRGLEAVDA